MRQCPRCGVELPFHASSCPRCGLAWDPHGHYTESGAGGRRSSALVGASVVLSLLVTAMLVVGALWLLDVGPFGAHGDDEAGPRPIPTTTPTSTPTPSPTPTTPTTTGVPSDFSEVYAGVQDGVAVVNVATCRGGGTGTGFLVDESTMVTAAHVVAGATELSIDFDSGPVAVTVAGIDKSLDLAILRLNAPQADRHQFALGTEPREGMRVAVIGYPLGEPKGISQGIVSGLDRTITTESGTLNGLVVTDAAINPGNSGGPMIDLAGELVGITTAKRIDAEGIGYAVPSELIEPAIRSGAGLVQPSEPGCVTEDPVEQGVRRTFSAYFNAINTRDYEAAMRWVGPSIRADSNEQQWQQDYATTYDDRIEVLGIRGPASAPTVWVTFRSQQEPGYGPADAPDLTCAVWSIDYHLTLAGGRYVIASVDGNTDPPWSRCS